MYCKYCGKKIADDSSFCQFCGGKVSLKSMEETSSILSQAKSSIAKESKENYVGKFLNKIKSFIIQHINTLKYVGIWCLVCFVVSLLDCWEDGDFDGIDLFWWILIGSIIIIICTNWKEICSYWEKKYPHKNKKAQNGLDTNELFKCPRCGDIISKSKISYYKSDRTNYSFSGRWMISRTYDHYDPLCEKCASFRNKADNIINGICCLNVLICVAVFIFGGFFDSILGGIILGVIAGGVITFVFKYTFYIYDEIRMFYVRKKKK